ncbi:acyl-CoA synthetase [Paracoccus niistensis]|uniref:Acyl-CoA synthetase n=1 Tax=Paracoccus niistensis TaxID=632935 RepID=A0ABV6I0W5_9RHOB
MTDTAAAPARPAHAEATVRFRIEDAVAGLQGDLASGLNACVECCDRHAGANRLALRWVAADGHLEDFTFEQLRDMAARVANMLVAQGIGPGDVVAGLLPRTPELMAAVLGTWRAGAVYQPLFTAFGPKAIEHRLQTAGTRLVVTDSANRAKLDGIDRPVQVATVLSAGESLREGDVDFRAALAAAPTEFQPVIRKGDDLFLMMSTSGTTGLPKGVPVPLKALLSFAAYMRDAIGLREDDVFWNIADPGWAYGLYYAVTGPLLLGQATTLNEGGFTVEGACDTITRLGVTNLAGSPTAFRQVIAAGPGAAERIRGRLRVVSSAGEPLNPEVIRWFDRHLGVPIHDHYGQTEVGMVVNNHHGLDHPVRPGSAGLTMPGWRVVVLDDAGRELEPGQPGILAIDIARSPLMWFGGYLNTDTPAIAGGYYRTGDSVEFEEDGSVSFIGRADDVITSSGYRIGPFDVESALLEHPAVREAAVVGVPDPERTEIVKAFVVLAQGHEGSAELAEELRLHVRSRLSAHAYPRCIDFVADLPKTPSGKIQRFLLRKAEIARLEQDQRQYVS